MSMKMAVKSMEMAVESMEMALGAIPCPDRVPEQRLLSPEIALRRRQRCRTLSGKTLIDLGFLHWRLYIGGGAMSEGTQGPHTTGLRGQGAPAPPPGVVASWPLSVSALDSLSCWEKIGTLGFVSSNSENISCVNFLKHKTAKNRELALWHLVNRLVPENA
jgi:hypothetical protein